MKAVNSSKRQSQTASNQLNNHKRGRKLQEKIQGILSQHNETIRFFLQLYENGAMDKPFETGLATFVRFIYELEILCYVKNKTIKSLSISSVDTEVREAWREIRKERENTLSHKKVADRNKPNEH